MLQNYLKTGLRNILKNKLFSIINISGMAISMASFLVIALFVHDELQYDKYVSNASLKFRLYNEHFNADGPVGKFAMIPPVIASTMEAEFPELQAYARIMNFSSPVLFEQGGRKFSETNGGYADPYILNMFDLKLIEGESSAVLKEPNMIAISSTLKNKYFGDKPALGETMQVMNEDFIVSAVFEDFPANSHLQLNFFVAMERLARESPHRMQDWGWTMTHTYLEFKPGADESALEPKLRKFIERHAWPLTKGENGDYYVPHLLPLRDIHLHASDHMWDIAVRGNAQTVYILSATAIFILLIAILNFINLSTARAVNRVKEVGVRKVVGAARGQLICQFISESIIVSLTALFIGGLIAEILVPMLNSFTEKSISSAIFLNPLVIFVLFIAALVIGAAAGAYPAFYVSGYRPADILSNKGSGKSGKALLRQGLVVLQFVLSFFLIIGAFVVSDQNKYLRTQDMGFQKDNVISIELRGNMANDFQTTKREFANHPNVISASLQYGLPGEAFAGDGIKDATSGKDISMSMLLVDHDYLQTLGLRLVAGRDFSIDRPSDANDAFIVSEEGAKLLGYPNPQEALEHPVTWNRWDHQDSIKHGKIVGVVKDLHLNGLKEKITPVVMHIFPYAYSSISFRIKEENIPETIRHFESTWKKFNTEWPFEYRFLDDNFERIYKSEERVALLFTFFSGFTIFVACLGLFGLVVYSTSQKYKEISIRKVLGAATSSVVLGLSKTYMLLIAIAFVVAVPLSYWAAEQWLQKFANHIEITPMLFVKAASFITILALLTVGIQSLRAARANPVNALKEQ